MTSRITPDDCSVFAYWAWGAVGMMTCTSWAACRCFAPVGLLQPCSSDYSQYRGCHRHLCIETSCNQRERNTLDPCLRRTSCGYALEDVTAKSTPSRLSMGHILTGLKVDLLSCEPLHKCRPGLCNTVLCMSIPFSAIWAFPGPFSYCDDGALWATYWANKCRAYTVV